MTDTNELREKIQDVLDACGNHSLSEDTIIYIKDTLGIFVSKKLAQAVAEGVKEERNAIFKDIIEKGGFIGVQGDKEYNCDVVCRLVLDENDK